MGTRFMQMGLLSTFSRGQVRNLKHYACSVLLSTNAVRSPQNMIA
jgi:hypothetical protein